jgi:hypothetical protein
MNNRPHYLNKEWQYEPSTTHGNSTKFRERMEQRKREIEQQKQQTNVPTSTPTITTDNNHHGASN